MINFGNRYIDDPWDFKIRYYFFYTAMMPKEVVVKMHPLTSGAGVLYIDGGGIRSILPLGLIKRIRDRISLLILF